MAKLRQKDIDELTSTEAEELEQHVRAKIHSHAQKHVNGMPKQPTFENLSFLISDDQASPEAALEALADLKDGNANFLE